MILLKCILVIIVFLGGIVLGGYWINNAIKEKIAYYYILTEKYFEMINVFKIWLEYIEQGNRVEDYFHKKEYKKVAIYGIGFLGERLLLQLMDTDIEIAYILDKRQGNVYGNVPVLSLDDNLDIVDVVVITPIYYFWSIKKEINIKHPQLNVISIEEIFS